MLLPLLLLFLLLLLLLLWLSFLLLLLYQPIWCRSMPCCSYLSIAFCALLCFAFYVWLLLSAGCCFENSSLHECHVRATRTRRPSKKKVSLSA